MFSPSHVNWTGMGSSEANSDERISKGMVGSSSVGCTSVGGAMVGFAGVVGEMADPSAGTAVGGGACVGFGVELSPQAAQERISTKLKTQSR